MFLLNSLTIVILFVLSLILPVTSFLLPMYKIKKMQNLSIKKNILANIVAMIVITFINPLLLAIYILFYLSIELLYYYFNKKLSNVKKFDRIVITSIVISFFMGILGYFLRDDFVKNINFVMEAYKNNMNLTTAEATQLLLYIKNNALFFLFDYAVLCVFFIYISVDFKNYKKWEFSFEWLVVYIIPFFMIHILKIDNFYTRNIMEIGQAIFTFFGIKTLYSFISEYSKFKGLNNLLAFITAILCPFATFVIGVLGSFFYKNKDKN